MTTYNSPFSGNVIQPTDVSYQQFYLPADIVLWWPINGVPPTYDVAARIMDISASGNGFTIAMPPANQASVGQDALFNNTGSYNIDIIDYTSGAITTVAAGKSEYIYITDNTTTDGVWGVVGFGATTSNANAATLAGYGLLAIANTLNQSHPIKAVVDAYTFLPSDRANTMVWSSGAGSATLDTAVTIGSNWFILFKNDGTGTFTVNTTGVDTLDQQSTKTFQPNESALIVCTGSGYITVGYGTSNTFFFTALTKAVTTGTYTLTVSEAQSIIQEYVGSLAGNVTVVYPPVVALYIVNNLVTANGFSFQITTGLGGSNTVAIPSGQTVSLICDGTNFYNANTVQSGATVGSLANGTVGAPSLNFSLETSTGLYRPGVGTMGLSILGTNLIVFDAQGVDVTGTGNFTDGISGGVF